MINLVFSRSLQSLRTPIHILHRPYHVGKAGSVNTAIQRGLRKSGDPRERSRTKHDIPEYKPSRDSPWPGSRETREVRPERSREGRTKPQTFDRPRRGRTGDDGDFAKRNVSSGSATRGSDFQKRHGRDSASDDIPHQFRDVKPEGVGRTRGSGRRTPEWKSRTPGTSAGTYSRGQLNDADSYNSRSNDQSRSLRDKYPSLSSSKSSSGSSSQDLVSGSIRPSEKRSFDRFKSDSSPRDRRFNDKFPSKSDKAEGVSGRRSSDGYKSSASEGNRRFNEKPWPTTEIREPIGKELSRYKSESSERNGRFTDRNGNGQTERSSATSSQDMSTTGPKIIKTVVGIPLSIPYTTPASEFLYGASVVEAALSSQREPRRKLYKLYIYTGDNRENADRDAGMERLAKRNGVRVVRAGNDWLRVMDKMSAGRPHNGYILEASPLPRLPITNLGPVTTKDGEDGFEISLDYQSREEAAVNGTSDFIRIPKQRDARKPFVLLLDSITDPGNLGGIIRTASFLGVNAIAISTRNSASFTPVVLKASAGASENVTLFSVKNPAGFVVDSKSAGWKVFAAVAPTKKHDPGMPMSISTDDLKNPLSKDPCILMLGSEGEGLRWNLRSKADVDLYIQGCGQSQNVDSLNVSVATGILCNSFLRKDAGDSPKTPPIQHEHEQKEEVPTGDLF